eukprot:g2861.t1
MKSYEALWGALPIDHKVSTIVVSDANTIWTGSYDGTIVRWNVTESGKIHPGLYLTYHQSMILQIIPDASSSDSLTWSWLLANVDLLDVVISGDANGVFCSWSYFSGLCLCSKKHDILNGTISGNFTHADTREICFAFHPHEQEENKETFHLAFMDVLSLEMATVWECPNVLSFTTSDDPLCPCEIVELMSCTGEGEMAMSSAVAVTSNGNFIIWQKTVPAFSVKDLKKLMFGNGLPLKTPLPVTSACFASNGRTVLLLSHCAWFLLNSETLHEETGLPCQLSILAYDYPVLTLPSFQTSQESIPEMQKVSSFGDELSKTSRDQLQGGLVLTESHSDKQSDLKLLIWHSRGVISVISCNKSGQWSHKGNSMVSNELKSIKIYEREQILQVQNLLNEAEMIVFTLDYDQGDAVFFRETARGKISDVWTEKAPDQSEGKSESTVSCIYMITGLLQFPYILVQGLANGDILFFSLSWYSTPFDYNEEHPGAFLRRSVGHKAAVVICQEALFQQPASSESLFPASEIHEDLQLIPLLITGALDGSIHFWSLAPQSLGTPLFSVHPHLGAVKQMICPQKGSPAPWNACLVTVSEDGVIAITSLEQRETIRLLTGSPPSTQLYLKIDYRRGFLSSLGRPQFQNSTLVVWDLYSGAQDRVFHGLQAEEMEKLIADGIEEFNNEHPIDTKAPLYHTVYACRLSFIQNSANNEIKLFNGPKPGLSILEMDIKSLLHGLSQNENSKTLTNRATTCMSALHIWGVDSKTDSTVLDMIREMDIINGSPHKSSSITHLDLTSHSSLSQGVVFSSNRAITVDFPHSIKDSKIGALWASNPDFVAGWLVVMVSISKQLLHDGFNEVVCTTSSAIATMFAIQFLQLVPQCCSPSLGVIALLWDDPIDILKDTSRVLLASLTDLATMYELLSAGVEFTGPGSTEIKTIYKMGQDQPNALSAVSLTQHQMEILVAGAICCVHCRLADPHLVVIVVPFLAALATYPIDSARSSILACLILRDALTGIESATWFAALSDQATFLTRILDTCDQQEMVQRVRIQRSNPAPQQPQGPIPKKKSRANLKESSPGTSGNDRCKNLAHVFSDEKSFVSKTHHGRNRSFGSLRFVFSRSRSSQDSEHNDFSVHGTESNDSDAYKDALVSLIESIAFLDLYLVLATLSQRVPCSCQWPYSVVAVVRAIGGLLRRRDGPQQLLQQLSFLISVLIKTLDPSDQNTRRISSHMVLSLLSRMNKMFPMMDIHHEHGLLAVGYPLKLTPNLSEGVGPSNQEAVGVFSIQTGTKRRALSLGRIFEQIATQLSSRSTNVAPDLRVGALSFRKDGEVIAAFFPGVRGLCVWDLRMTWQQKISSSRSHIMTPLEPVKILQIQESPAMAIFVDTGEEVDLSYKLVWQLSSQIAVMKGEIQLDSVELHLGN